MTCSLTVELLLRENTKIIRIGRNRFVISHISGSSCLPHSKAFKMSGVGKVLSVTVAAPVNSDRSVLGRTETSKLFACFIILDSMIGRLTGLGDL